MSTLLVLFVVLLAGWAVAFALRPRSAGRDAQREWEHWLEGSGLRPVIPRMTPVVEAATAAGRDPGEVDRAAMGRARDGAPLVVAQLVDGAVLVAARRAGPVPDVRAALVGDGWQLTITDLPVPTAFERAGWIRTGPPIHR